MLITVLAVGGVPDLESVRITPQTKTLAVTTTAQVREMHVFCLVTQKRVHARAVMSTHSVQTLAAAPIRLIFVGVRQHGAVRTWHAKNDFLCWVRSSIGQSNSLIRSWFSVQI